MKKEYLIGINYFNGWNRNDPNRWQTNGRDWRMDYPERIPVTGCYNDPETMIADIDAASEKGVDFFQMLWYVQKPEREKNSRHLNDCFAHYFAAKNNEKIKFVLEFCNHPPYEILEDDLWEDSVDEWVKIMLHPGCLKIDGKAVFKIHGLAYFYQQCSRSVEKFDERISVLRAKAKGKGLELIIGAGVMADAVNDDEIALSSHVDYCTTYADFPRIEETKKPYAFSVLTEQALKGRRVLVEKLHSPYVPFIMSGWYPRPWGVHSAQYAYPTEKEWKEALQGVKTALDEDERFTLHGKKMFTIYAWNEFGEGGIMAPTAGFGTMKLDMLKKVFGEK